MNRFALDTLKTSAKMLSAALGLGLAMIAIGLAMTQ